MSQPGDDYPAQRSHSMDLLMVVRVRYSQPVGPYAARKALGNVLASVDLQAVPALYEGQAQIYIEKLEVVT